MKATRKDKGIKRGMRGMPRRLETSHETFLAFKSINEIMLTVPTVTERARLLEALRIIWL